MGKEKKFVRAFTLLELTIVIIIIGVLATLGVSQYGSLKENTLDKEAKANLKLIIAGERVCRMELQEYVKCDDNDAINTNLKLLLETTDQNWNYRTTANNTPPNPSSCAQATRNVAGGRTWKFDTADAEPVADGVCP